MDWGKLFFSAHGRTGRKDFWITFLILVGAGLLIGWIPFVGLVILYSGICIRSKRLHDMGRTGWLQLVPVLTYVAVTIFTLYYVIGAIIAGANWNHLTETAATVGLAIGGLTLFGSWMVAFLVDIAFLLWIGLSEGEASDNRFGPQRAPQGEGLLASA